MNKISVDPLIQNGNPCISGTRITVLDVVLICEESSITGCMEAYRQLDRDTVLTALRYCSGRVCDSDGGHCGGCVLRPIQDGIMTAQDFVNRFEKVIFRFSDEVLYGTGKGVGFLHCAIDELEENWRGVKGWEIADRILMEIDDKAVD